MRNMATNFLKALMDKPYEGPIDIKRLIATIEAGYIANNKREFKKKKSFSPSTLVYGHGACPRYWSLAFTGTEFYEERTPYEVANMNSGTVNHGRIQEAITNAGIAVEIEKRILASDPPLFGFADAIIQWGEDQPVVEIKTMREESFGYRKFAKAPNYHVMQLVIYMYVLRKKLGILLYESKNTHELHAISIEMTPEREAWVELAFQWMRDVRKAWEDGTLPMKPYRANSKICKKCPVRDTCFAAEKGEIKISPLEYLE